MSLLEITLCMPLCSFPVTAEITACGELGGLVVQSALLCIYYSKGIAAGRHPLFILTYVHHAHLMQGIDDHCNDSFKSCIAHLPHCWDVCE